MVNRFLITIVLLGSSLFGTIWAEHVPIGFLHELNVPVRQYSGSTYFAQISQKDPPDNVSGDDASTTRKNKSKSKMIKQDKHIPEKTKPVKPFVPSEEIPVDQGVDFPYDI